MLAHKGLLCVFASLVPAGRSQPPPPTDMQPNSDGNAGGARSAAVGGEAGAASESEGVEGSAAPTTEDCEAPHEQLIRVFGSPTRATHMERGKGADSSGQSVADRYWKRYWKRRRKGSGKGEEESDEEEEGKPSEEEFDLRIHAWAARLGPERSSDDAGGGGGNASSIHAAWLVEHLCMSLGAALVEEEIIAALPPAGTTPGPMQVLGMWTALCDATALGSVSASKLTRPLALPRWALPHAARLLCDSLADVATLPQPPVVLSASQLRSPTSTTLGLRNEQLRTPSQTTTTHVTEGAASTGPSANAAGDPEPSAAGQLFDEYLTHPPPSLDAGASDATGLVAATALQAHAQPAE